MAGKPTLPYAMRSRWPLVASMATAIALVAGLAWWDEQREAQAALRDLEVEQSTLAASLAGDLRAHLDGATGAAASAALVSPAALLGEGAGIERPGELMLLLSPPGSATLENVNGHAFSSRPLRDALDHGRTSARLSRAESAELGLPARTSMAGLARVDAGSTGVWAVVVVASAARERDRESRAVHRLVLGVLTAAGLVLAFGGAALRRQRKELDLERALAVARAQRARDEELAKAARVATTGTFAMGVAHEVSTPLGVIVGRAEQLLARVQGDERATRSAQAILQQAQTIERIVRRFLDMARGGPPTLEATDPRDIVTCAAAAVEHRFAKAEVSLATRAPPQTHHVRCDRALLEHALVNLLLNACDACSSGGHVELSVSSQGDVVAFVVTDDGVGIPPEDAARATEPFFTTKADGRGTGLGLAIATEIVKGHRGTLTLAPNASRGTRACIEVPASTQRPATTRAARADS